MDPNEVRTQVVQALAACTRSDAGAGELMTLNLATDRLATWIRTGGYPPDDGPVKVDAKARRRLRKLSPARLEELDALNELLRERATTRSNPAMDVHRLEAGEALQRAETHQLEAEELVRKGRYQQALGPYTQAVAMTAVATREADHGGPSSTTQQLRLERVQDRVAFLQRMLEQSLPKRRRRPAGVRV